jgi:hypothetical protein
MTVTPMRKRPRVEAPGRSEIDQLPGEIKPSNSANSERQQHELRIYRLAERLHECGPRPLQEFLLEMIDAYDGPVLRRLETYAAMDAQFIRDLGGDRLRIEPEIVPSEIGCDE